MTQAVNSTPAGIQALSTPSALHEPPCDPMCSSRRCVAPAVWALKWNNPRLHEPERRKTWLACDEHREHLTSFLSMRGFMRETELLLADRTHVSA